MQHSAVQRANPHPPGSEAWEVWESGYTCFHQGKTEVPSTYRGEERLVTLWLSGWYAAKRDAVGDPKAPS